METVTLGTTQSMWNGTLWGSGRDLMAAVCLNVLFSSLLCEGCKWTQSSHFSLFVSKIAFKTVS